jgi:hypothetical protein
MQPRSSGTIIYSFTGEQFPGEGLVSQPVIKSMRGEENKGMKNVLLIAATIIVVLCALSFQSFAQLQPPPRERQEIDRSPRLMPLPRTGPIPPKVTGFSINNGARNTTSTIVTLNNWYYGPGGALYYRADEHLNDLSTRGWLPYSNAPQIRLSTGDGEKTVYFQIKNKDGLVSNIASDTIILTEREKYSATAYEVYNYAKGKGYTFTSTANDSSSGCKVFDSHVWQRLYMEAYGLVSNLGAKCNFALFNKSLREGWTFYSDELNTDECKPPSDRGNRNCSILERPNQGNSNMTYRIRGWCDAPSVLNIGLSCYCKLSLYIFMFEGPAHKKWQDAFE